MSYKIRMGVPEMSDFWNRLCELSKTGKLKGADRQLFKKLVKALKFLEKDPRYPIF
jgi:hypothetical protein